MSIEDRVIARHLQGDHVEDLAAETASLETKIEKALVAAGFFLKQSRTKGDITDYDYQWKAVFGRRHSQVGYVSVVFMPNAD